MTDGNVSLEREIAAWLVEQIKAETLLDTIAGRDSIERAAMAHSSDSVIPAFGFDDLSRRANVLAAAAVLQSLTLLDVVSINTSISITRREVLRPDILCFNPESRTLVVFEIKRDKLTERQAITELAAYEQELRNTLPLLGDFDIHFVVVSTQWDTLLDHAVSNFNAWSGKRCLALQLSSATRPFALTCRVPQGWQLRGGVGLPEGALQTVDVFLYEDEQPSATCNPQVPPELLTTLNVIARSGDRVDSHGFLLLWHDQADFANGQWALTLCGVDPYAIQTWCEAQGLKTRPSELTGYLAEHASDLSGKTPSSLFRIAKDAFPLLQSKFNPKFENLTSWDTKFSLIRRRAVPVAFEFWGALGDYARQFVCNPLVRDRYFPYMGEFGLDWTAPSVAFPLIGLMCGDVPFPGGLVRCRDAFRAGVTLGQLEQISTLADASLPSASRLEPLVNWSLLEAVRIHAEMTEIYRTAAEINQPPPALSDERDSRSQRASALAMWAHDHLLGADHPIHQLCFNVGRSGALFFSPWTEPAEKRAFLQQHGEGVAGELRGALREVLSEAERQDLDLPSMPALQAFLSMLDRDPTLGNASPFDAVPTETLLNAFPDPGIDALDEFVPAVLHTVQPIDNMVIDWDGVRDSICQLFRSGCKWPVVSLRQNGALGIGELHPDYRALASPITNPGVEVYFIDERASDSLLVKLPWERVEALFTAPSRSRKT